ncbi:DUF1376 domain-containing protein [Salmonella enterica]|nr:DUF1376 domain-containing protein [Salmonella enterica]
MQLYIADYLADTMHLSAEEHGAYLLLMFNYWQTGRAIPKSRLAKIARISSERWGAVEESLREFFIDTLTTSLHDPLPPGAVIHIVPRLAGAKSGGVFQAVLGAALIAVVWWNPAGWLGAAAVSGMYMTGASMILGGVAQMLAPKPKMSEMRQTDNGRQNTYFSSLDNMVANGNTLPVLYGEMQVGSRVISQEISTADEGDGGQVVVIGR